MVSDTDMVCLISLKENHGIAWRWCVKNFLPTRTPLVLLCCRTQKESEYLLKLCGEVQHQVDLRFVLQRSMDFSASRVSLIYSLIFNSYLHGTAFEVNLHGCVTIFAESGL